jgi:hypothetical protein
MRRLSPDAPVPIYRKFLTADTDGVGRDGRLLLYNTSVAGFIELLECFALELCNGHLAEHLGIALASYGAFNNFAGHNLSQGLFPLRQAKHDASCFKSPVHGFERGGFER